MRLIGAVLLACLAAGCASQRASVDRSDMPAEGVPFKKTPAAQIQVIEGDLVGKRYAPLSDISVTVSKTTIFNTDPTREDVNRRLREEAEKLGADAVIFVRYGTVGVSAFSWGSLNGRGRAVSIVP